MKKRITISLLSICIFAVCINTHSSDIPLQLDRTKTLQGVDADQNGIRDDIDRYIKKKYSLEKQQKAVSQYARSLQASLLVDKENRNAVKAVTNTKAKAISCIHEKIPKGRFPGGGSVVKEILSITTNTKLRLLAYVSLDKALDGSVISLPSGTVCEE